MATTRAGITLYYPAMMRNPAAARVAGSRRSRYNGRMSVVLEPTQAWLQRTRGFSTEGPLRGGERPAGREHLQTACAVAVAVLAALLLIALGTLLRASPPRAVQRLAGTERIRVAEVTRPPAPPALYPPVTGLFMQPRGGMLSAARRPATTVYALGPVRDLSHGLPSPAWTADQNGLLHGVPPRVPPDDILD